MPQDSRLRLPSYHCTIQPCIEARRGKRVHKCTSPCGCQCTFHLLCAKLDSIPDTATTGAAADLILCPQHQPADGVHYQRGKKQAAAAAAVQNSKLLSRAAQAASALADEGHTVMLVTMSKKRRITSSLHLNSVDPTSAQLLAKIASDISVTLKAATVIDQSLDPTEDLCQHELDGFEVRAACLMFYSTLWSELSKDLQGLDAKQLRLLAVRLAHMLWASGAFSPPSAPRYVEHIDTIYCILYPLWIASTQVVDSFTCEGTCRYCKPQQCSDQPDARHACGEDRPCNWSDSAVSYVRFISPASMTVDECTAFISSHAPTVRARCNAGNCSSCNTSGMVCLVRYSSSWWPHACLRMSLFMCSWTAGQEAPDSFTSQQQPNNGGLGSTANDAPTVHPGRCK